jgi:hypothetical protein
VTGTHVNFSGMTGRALAVILKINFLKIVRSQKKLYLNEVVRLLTGHPVYPISFVKKIASIVTVSKQQKARPGSTAAHNPSTFYLIKLKP